ncbi:MAG TPA: hypothetical protein VLW50_02530 [Streptosporangiaceae bacterium]|nr:hypothetical protein [Streptosporangiaceae bacterium]
MVETDAALIEWVIVHQIGEFVKGARWPQAAANWSDQPGRELPKRSGADYHVSSSTSQRIWNPG